MLDFCSNICYSIIIICKTQFFICAIGVIRLPYDILIPASCRAPANLLSPHGGAYSRLYYNRATSTFIKFMVISK